jgi:hypothetical protein
VLAALWDAQGILLELLDHRAAVNVYCYCTTLRYLKEAICIKCLGLLTGKLILLHSPHTHTTLVTRHHLDQFHWKCLAHPPYNPDLVPSNFNIIRPQEKYFERKQF